jgi:mannitol-specific phosphotransferase system IIBC component
MTIEIVIGVIVAAVIAYVIYQAVTSDDKKAPVVPPVAKVIDEVAKATAEKPKAKKKTSKKKPSQKKLQDETLNAMNKKELLEVAKLHNIKANASLKKDEIIQRIKNG